MTPLVENLAAGTGSSYGISAAITSWTSEVCAYIMIASSVISHGDIHQLNIMRMTPSRRISLKWVYLSPLSPPTVTHVRTGRVEG